MTALEKLTTILARTPGVPDSTSLTMGGEVELEVTIGDLRMLAATLAEALASANHQRKQKQASNISRNRAVQGIEHWKARAEAAEANLARAREIMKPGGDWRVVPAEPTEAMVEAAVGRPDNPDGDMYSNIYRAMLSAAPLPPEQGDGNGG